jgi:predicted enzyme related to lactoylglutathione lyase
MTANFGMPIWYELATTDAAAASRFYGDIVGWTSHDFGVGADYALWTAADGTAVAGLLALPDRNVGAGPGWYAYFHVADVDTAVTQIEQAGGTVRSAPRDVPGAGRMAMVADPQGVVFYVITPPSTEPGVSTSFSLTMPQRCGWNELVTTDQTAALPFYAELFGWTSTESMPMGPMGDYSFIDGGEVRLGAMMNRQFPDQPARWGFYFHIPDVDAAIARIVDSGGQVVMGPMDVPGGQRIVVAVDPQGASVGFVSGDPA